MELRVRPAEMNGLEKLAVFARDQAREAEAIEKVPKVLRTGIKTALNDKNIGQYWFLLDRNDKPVGNISAMLKN
jgi:hypothetical protein